MKKICIKKASAVVLAGLLPFSAIAEDGNTWSISGWINQAITYADDGENSRIVSLPDNGTTLGSRIVLAGSSDLLGNGLTAGFEVIIEPEHGGGNLGFGTNGRQALNDFESTGFAGVNTLGHSLYLKGSMGKITLGQQSMPSDNTTVLEDPSMTLWSSIGAVFRGTGVFINSANNNAASAWGDFLNCYTNENLRGRLGIGMDCNGTYRQGVRYDLPTLPGGVDIALGYSNGGVYDVSGKWKGEFGRIKTQLAISYAINTANRAITGLDNNNTPNGSTVTIEESQLLQAQLGIMDVPTGLFAAVSYASEEADFLGNTNDEGLADNTNSYWVKAGIKRAFNSLGDTSIAIQYGSYNDQFGINEAIAGVNGSEVTRMGIEVNQYFGNRLIIYGTYERLSVDLERDAGSTYLNDADDLDMFTTGLTFFF